MYVFNDVFNNTNTYICNALNHFHFLSVPDGDKSTACFTRESHKRKAERYLYKIDIRW